MPRETRIGYYGKGWRDAEQELERALKDPKSRVERDAIPSASYEMEHAKNRYFMELERDDVAEARATVQAARARGVSKDEEDLGKYTIEELESLSYLAQRDLDLALYVPHNEAAVQRQIDNYEYEIVNRLVEQQRQARQRETASARRKRNERTSRPRTRTRGPR